MENEPKRRGKPNPREAEIQETIARYEAGNGEPLPFDYGSPEKAKKGIFNLYSAFKNRGYKVSIAQDGAILNVRVSGSAPKKGARKSATRRKPGRPAKATRGAKRGRKPRAAGAASKKAPKASAAAILVRMPKGRGWSYAEFANKDAAAAYLYTLDGAGMSYEVFERKPVEVKRTIQGW